MSDAVRYNYPSMEDAYARMVSLTNGIGDTLADLTSDAQRLLDSFDTEVAGPEYHNQVLVLNGLVSDLNDEMTVRAQQLNLSFDAMRDLDHSLGSY